MNNKFLLEPNKSATRKDLVVMYELLETAIREGFNGLHVIRRREELVGLMNEGYKDVDKLNG